MNDVENESDDDFDTPRVRAILDWMDQFKYGADTFVLVRKVDHNGQSGTGVIADGVVFPDGRVNIRWHSGRSGVSQTESWDSLEDAMQIHGHRGDTVAEVVPVSQVVDAVRFALMIPGMVEVTDDPESQGYAAGWNACRRQVESKIAGGLSFAMRAEKDKA